MLKTGSMLVLLALAAMVAGDATMLDEAAFKAAIPGSGKNYLVKFFAPWCGHCKKLKPDWDKLADAFADSNSVVVADVDCTVEDSLCKEFGVSGYPTLKYFTDETGPEGAAYSGGRNYEELETFVNDNLSAKCSVEDRSACTDKESKFIDTMQERGAATIGAQLERLSGMKDKPMKPALSAWLHTRLRLLGELSANDAGKAEL